MAALTPELVRIPLVSTGKPEILSELSDILAKGAGIPDRTGEIRSAIERREALLSTGIGNGIALPHARSPFLARLSMAVGTTADPVDFSSLDGQPVRLVWMLAGPERTAGLNVRTLARISELLRLDSVRDALIGATSPEEFLARLAEAEGA